MEATTVPQAPDIRSASEDWRTGVVPLPADHVYGATALDDASWQLLNARWHGVFIVEERTAHVACTLMDREHPDRRSAQADMDHRIEMSPRAFDPWGPIRIVVTEVFR